MYIEQEKGEKYITSICIVTQLSLSLLTKIVLTKLSLTKLSLDILVSDNLVSKQFLPLPNCHLPNCPYQIVTYQIVTYQIITYQIYLTKNPPVILYIIYRSGAVEDKWIGIVYCIHMYEYCIYYI